MIADLLHSWPLDTPLFAPLARAIDEDPGAGLLAALASCLKEGEIEARALADFAAERLQKAGARESRGLHATPWPLAEWVVSRGGAGPGTILDPACGGGHLLVAAAEQQGAEATPADFHGWDVDGEAVAASRLGLWLATGRRHAVADFRHVRRRDALLAPESEAAEPVDQVLANPPFMSIRQLNRELSPGYVERLRRALPRLRGNFDLYVGFLLRLGDWLVPQGRYAVIVPATFWSAAYARRLRPLLATSLVAVDRIESRRLFPGAHVTPHVISGRRPAHGASDDPTESRTILFHRVACDEGRLSAELEGRVSATALAEDGYPAARRRREGTVALGELARISAGTPGYQAERVAEALREVDEPGDDVGGEATASTALPFVVTACIERYRLRDGPVRFMRRRFRRPVLPVSVLSEGKSRLFRSPKVLVAGVSRRLRAARDDRGRALGVGVYAIEPQSIPVELVLAILNAEVTSTWYRARFLGRELSGGYFGVNCSQLRAVPVPLEWTQGRGESSRIVELVRRREATASADEAGLLDERIEAAVGRALGP